MKATIDLQRQVPEAWIGLRPALPRDLPEVARWIGAGRREGAFQGAGTPTTAALRRYQRAVARAGWRYRCEIAEEAGRAAGFVDCRWRGRRGQILGVYLEPRFRGGRRGRHLLRWAAAALCAEGCDAVEVLVFADNAASLSTCAAAGFTRDPAGDQVDDGGRVTFTLRRDVALPRRLGPARPDRYRDLQGQNRFFHHAAMAEPMAEALGRIEGVDAVLGMGSLARGFADAWSDLDLAVVGRGPALDRLWRGERWMAGVSVDLYVVDLDAAPPRTWDESRRQAFEESVVLFTRPSGARRLADLARAVRLGRRERTERIVDLLFKAGWLGFVPRPWRERRRRGYLWALPHDLWLRRGCLASAHATADRVLDLALSLLFLINGRHPPDPKWRRFLAPGLAWLPRGFARLLAAAEGAPRTRTGFRARARALLALVDRCAARLEDTGALPADVYRVLLRTSPEYDSRR